MPLHYVCGVKNLDDAFSLEILTLFVEKCPESVRDAGSNGNLPIHVACGRGGKSPEFCRILIEAYPGSERMADNKGALPFHHACILGTVATAEYLYKLYPQANWHQINTDCIRFTMQFLALRKETTQQLLLKWCDFCWVAIPM